MIKKISNTSDNIESPTKQLSANDFKKKLSKAIHSVLKEKGFTKKGMNFSLEQNDLVYFIQIQSSRTSTVKVCKLTVNIGIVSLKLCELTDIIKPKYLDSHWSKRIGFYLDKPEDNWWTLSDSKSLDNAIIEITELLKNRVLPNIFSFKTTSDIKDFWLSRNYQGLTKKQQDYYLNLLSET